MRTFMLVSTLLPLSACQQALVAKRAADAVLAEGVGIYCRLPEPARLANRARVAAKVAPHRIEIHCASPSQSSPRRGEGQGGGMEG